ncbi:MAG: sigma-70 family RNA polymerase sigma factor [Mollicutes bacterium]|nr:sigma-70 family RNA polymerase sigma factor [Mollicutes bacterium]
MLKDSIKKEFNKIYQDTFDDITKYVVCRCSNIDDAKDIVQNTYLGVINALKKDKKIDKSYIYKIAKNKISDYYRFRYKIRIESIYNDEDEEKVSSPSFEESLFKKYDVNRTWKLLKKKNPVVGKIFYLYYYCEYSIKKISKELNLTESNVKNHIYRTLKELNKEMN